MSVLIDLHERNLLSKGTMGPPDWLPGSVGYLSLLGSTACGIATDGSDWDVIGFCFPPYEDVFPNPDKYIPLFGERFTPYEGWTKHHIEDEENDRSYDFTIYSLPKFVNLCRKNYPQMISALYCPDDHVLEMDEVAVMLRQKRSLFLGTKCFNRYVGMAQKNLDIILKHKEPSNQLRKDLFREHGYDVKTAYQAARLLRECEQILVEGDLDMTRDKDLYETIRAGRMSFNDFLDWYRTQLSVVKAAQLTSELPMEADEDVIRQLLFDCLEQHYGCL